MLIEVVCKQCGKKFGVRHTTAGRNARCPFCKTSTFVPLQEAATADVQDDARVDESPATEQINVSWPAEVNWSEFDDEEGSDRAHGEYEVDDEHDDDDDEHDDHAHDPFQQKQRKEFHDLIDMTAMVDIVFFLLIYFLVTSMYALKPAIPMPKPEMTGAGGSGSSSEGDSNVVNARIDEKDVVYVDDVVMPSERELRMKLEDIIRSGGPTHLKITGSPEASHGTLVMVMDVGAGAGMQKVQLAIKSADEF